MNLNANQSLILQKLSECSMPATPTELGQYCGKRYDQASSWACRNVKALVGKGLVQRNGALILLTDEGAELAKQMSQKGGD